jgi:5'(3')-deoxyribonucleotidase
MKTMYIDIDGVLADFKSASDRDKIDFPEQKYPQSQIGFFLNLKPIEDSLESFVELEKYFNVWILTRPSVQNPLCYTEKALWVKNHLGIDVQRRTIMATDKSLLKGDYLIDDDTKHGQTEFEGEHIHFGNAPFEDWKKVVEYILKKENIS